MEVFQLILDLLSVMPFMHLHDVGDKNHTPMCMTSTPAFEFSFLDFIYFFLVHTRGTWGSELQVRGLYEMPEIESELAPCQLPSM